jgi:hypothetical protein
MLPFPFFDTLRFSTHIQVPAVSSSHSSLKPRSFGSYTSHTTLLVLVPSAALIGPLERYRLAIYYYYAFIALIFSLITLRPDVTRIHVL